MSKLDRHLLTGIAVFTVTQLLMMVNPVFNNLLVPLILLPTVDSFFQKDWRFLERMFFGFLVFVGMGLSVALVRMLIALFM